MGVLRWKAWIRLGCPEGISRCTALARIRPSSFFLAEYFGRLVGTIDDLS